MLYILLNILKKKKKKKTGPLELEIPITKLETVGRTVHVLAARALIRDLENSTSHLHYRFTPVPASERSRASGIYGWWRRAVGGAGQDKASAWNLEPVTPPAGAVKREMVELGVRYQLVSPETSFVAVERWLDGRRGDVDAAPVVPSEVSSKVSSRLWLLVVERDRNGTIKTSLTFDHVARLCNRTLEAMRNRNFSCCSSNSSRCSSSSRC